MRKLICSGITGLAASMAAAQSFNVDMNLANPMPGNGVPANAFGAAANQAGFWNSVDNIGIQFALKDLAGANTSVTMNSAGEYIQHAANDGSATGEFAKLMEDTFKIAASNGSFTFVLSNMQAGKYFVYTYADDPADSLQHTRVTVNGSTQSVGGSHPSNQFVNNVTHSRHLVELTAGQQLLVSIGNNPNVGGSRGVISGLQIQKLPTRLYVNDDAPLGGNGLTWGSSFKTMEEAFDAIDTYGGAIDEVWVAGGTYITPQVPIVGYTFQIPDGVAFYGGFVGNETTLAQRQNSGQQSYLSGSIGAPGLADNAYHVVYAAGCGYDTVLDGFTIASGNADNPATWHYGTGGGMFIDDSQLTVRNCIFVGNQGWRGGAMAIQNSTPRIESCYFYNNTAEQSGGAIYTLEGGAPKIVDCDFRVNHATVNYGGAISHSEGTNMTVANCRFLDNDANWGGGGIFASTGNCTVANCVFTGNSGTADRGGAIHTFGENTYLFVYNSTVVGNYNYECGGIDAFAGANVWVRNSIVYDNTDNDPNTNVEREQLFKHSDSSMVVSYSDVEGWSGILGGAGNFNADPSFVDVDGMDNVLGTLDDDLRLSGDSPCIDRGSNALLPSDSADVDRDNNLIEPLPLDVDGYARRADDPDTADAGEGTAPVVDLGAHEFRPFALGDMNCDGVVSVGDIAGFVLALTNPAGYAAQYPNCDIENGDINGNGVVTVTDIGPFVQLVTGG